MQFVPIKPRDNWDAEKLERFRSEYLEITSMAFYSAGVLTNSSAYFARLLANTSKRAPIMRWSEAISSYSNCMDKYGRLFDHTYAFKRPFGKIIVLSAPYVNEDMAINAFKDVCEEHQELRHITMTIVPNKYKFIKNGDIMLMFEDCRLAHAAGDDHYTLLEE